mgnify:FL=1
MRGFVFSIDVVMGVIAVILMLLFLSQSIQPVTPNPHVMLQLQAKDAALAWFYGALYVPPDTTNKSYACDIAFRPVVGTVPLDPALGSSWVSQETCVVSP